MVPVPTENKMGLIWPLPAYNIKPSEREQGIHGRDTRLPISTKRVESWSKHAEPSIEIDWPLANIVQPAHPEVCPIINLALTALPIARSVLRKGEEGRDPFCARDGIKKVGGPALRYAYWARPAPASAVWLCVFFLIFLISTDAGHLAHYGYILSIWTVFRPHAYSIGPLVLVYCFRPMKQRHHSSLLQNTVSSRTHFKLLAEGGSGPWF